MNPLDMAVHPLRFGSGESGTAPGKRTGVHRSMDLTVMVSKLGGCGKSNRTLGTLVYS